jgi:predicted PurR-regulated permease PerM
MNLLNDRANAVSFGLFLLVFILAGALHLTAVLVAGLFAYLALKALCFGGRKWLSIVLFLALLSGLVYGFIHFLDKAIVALPEIAKTSVPLVVDYAAKHGIQLPFTDMESLQSLAWDSARYTVAYLGTFAKTAKGCILLIVGVVVAMGIFLNGRIDQELGKTPPNAFSFYSAGLARLFGSLYSSFETVFGAQVIISAINTVLTAIFVYGNSLHHSHFVIVLTFLCGMLPVIGNIISNTVIVGIAFSYSPQFAAWALLFLIVIHKLEYFLNSKIIGSRIRHPMWLTLLAIVIGESLLGIAGIILAPVILHFIKTEASKFDAPASATDVPPTAAA